MKTNFCTQNDTKYQIKMDYDSEYESRVKKNQVWENVIN